VQGLKLLGFSLNPRQISQVAKVFDTGNGDGKIDLEEFLAFCEAKDVVKAFAISKGTKKKKKKKLANPDAPSSEVTSSPATRGKKSKGAKSGGDEEYDDLELVNALKDIQTKMNGLAKGSAGKPQYRKAFARWDKDGNGVIDVAEFTRGLTEVGHSFNEKQIDQIAGVLDVNSNGKLEIDEFQQFCEARDLMQALKATKSNEKKKKKKR